MLQRDVDMASDKGKALAQMHRLHHEGLDSLSPGVSEQLSASVTALPRAFPAFPCVLSLPFGA